MTEFSSHDSVRVVDDRIVAVGDVGRNAAIRIGSLVRERDVVLIDLADATFIDTDAVSELLSLHRRDPRVRIVEASPIVRRGLTLSRAGHLLGAEPDAPTYEGPGSAMMRCVVDHDRIVVGGEIDASTVHALTEAFEQNPHLHRVDLTDVTFMDSSALRTLVDAHRREPQFRVVAASRSARRILEITGLLFLLDEE